MFFALTIIFTIHKYQKISNEITPSIVEKAILFYDIAQSMAIKKYIVKNMADFFKEKFIQGNYSANNKALERYIDNVDWYIKDVILNDNGIQGAWFTVNPDLFISLKGDKITLQNFSFTSWYYRDSNGELIKGPRENRMITPENDPYYFKAVKTNGRIITKIYKDKTIHVDMISLSCPIFTPNGELIGVAGIDITKDRLIEVLKRVGTTSDSLKIYIFDSDGKYNLGTASPSEKLLSYVNRIQPSIKDRPLSNNLIDGNWILIENQNNKDSFLVGEIPLNKINGNLSCILFMLYGLCFTLFICLILFFVLLDKKIPQADLLVPEDVKRN